MSMANEKERDLAPEDRPDEGSEEKKYSFLQETIKPKPISRKQLGRQLARFAIYGIVLGVFSCVGFYALRPWAQNWFRGDLKTVTIPEDEEPSEETQNTQDEEAVEEPVVDAESYEQIMDSMEERADEAYKGLVSVEPVSADANWDARMTGINRSTTGIIAADNGQEILILTDAEICSGASEWNVVFQDGSRYATTLKKKDENSGLAVFSVSRGNITDTTWSAIKVSVLGNSNLITQGDPVLALGNMFGYAGGASFGMVSSVDYKTAFYDGECDVIATDIPASQGGAGVLFNMDGEVIGLISDSVWEGKETSVANAYAISDLKTIIEFLANGEAVPYIGVHVTTVTTELQESQGMPAGVYVVDVDADSPAMAAGIQSGDIICQVARQDTTTISAFQRGVWETSAGQEIIIQGKRLGAEGYVDVQFTATVGSRE